MLAGVASPVTTWTVSFQIQKSGTKPFKVLSRRLLKSKNLPLRHRLSKIFLCSSFQPKCKNGLCCPKAINWAMHNQFRRTLMRRVCLILYLSILTKRLHSRWWAVRRPSKFTKCGASCHTEKLTCKTNWPLWHRLRIHPSVLMVMCPYLWAQMLLLLAVRCIQTMSTCKSMRWC